MISKPGRPRGYAKSPKSGIKRGQKWSNSTLADWVWKLLPEADPGVLLGDLAERTGAKYNTVLVTLRRWRRRRMVVRGKDGRYRRRRGRRERPVTS